MHSEYSTLDPFAIFRARWELGKQSHLSPGRVQSEGARRKAPTEAADRSASSSCPGPPATPAFPRGTGLQRFPDWDFGRRKEPRAALPQERCRQAAAQQLLPLGEEMGLGHPTLHWAWALLSAQRCAGYSRFPQNVSVAVLRKWKNDTLSCATSFQGGQQWERRQSQGTRKVLCVSF